MAAREGDPEQSAAAGHLVHRARARDRRSQGHARCDPTGHAAGHGGPGQDAAVTAGGGRTDGAVPRRRVVPGPVAAARRGTGGQRDGPCARRARRARPAAAAGAVLALEEQARAADPGQLRTPDQAGGRHGARDRQGGAGRAHDRLQPRGAACSRREGLPDPAAAGARPQGQSAGTAAFGGRATLRAARAGAQAGLRTQRAGGPGSGRTGGQARRHPAGARTGRGACALAQCGGYQHTAEGPLQDPHRGQPSAARAPADLARVGGLELRAAERERTS